MPVVLSSVPSTHPCFQYPSTLSAPYLQWSNTCKTPSIPGTPKSYYEHRAKSDHSVKNAREGAYQKECSHCRDLVQFHQQSECFLVVATVLLVHKEFVFLQGKTKYLIDSDTTRENILSQSFINSLQSEADSKWH